MTGRVESVHVYPVKGCRRTDVDRAVVEPWGLRGDRRWIVVGEDGDFVSQRSTPALTAVHPVLTADGVRLTAPGLGLPDLDVRAEAREPVDVTVWSATFGASPTTAEADAWLTRVAGRPVRLVWMDDPTRRPVDSDEARPGDVVSAADGFPLLLASTSSLAALNDWIAAGPFPEQTVPMERFRPSVVLSGFAPWAEDGWTGRRLRIGETVVRVAGPCGRCVVTTTDQDTGVRGKEPLRTLGRHRRIGKLLAFAVNAIPDGPGTVRVGDEVELLDA